MKTAQDKDESLKLVNAALDEAEGGEIILRGVLDPSSLRKIKVGSYQREVLPSSKVADLKKAVVSGDIPDIDLGMRGGSYVEKEGVFFLHDEVFVIDGLQRISAATQVLGGGKTPRVGAVVHFNTTEEWERERFRILNISRIRLAPNVLIRNMRTTSPVIELLYNLTLDKSFALYDRVTWDQNMQRKHLITANTFLKTAGRLHARFGPGMRTTGHADIANGLQKVMGRIGRNVLRGNISYYWDFVDEAWGVKAVQFKESATHLRSNFLNALAFAFSDYQNFWEDSKLSLARDLRKKVASFPITDPTIINLVSTGGQAKKLLFTYLVDHINSGKRTKRLVPFKRVVTEEEYQTPSQTF